MFIIVSYDITDDRRRNRISTILGNYGNRAQFSVFECDIEKAQLEKLKKNIDKVIDYKEDSVRFYCMCESCYSKIITWGKKPLAKIPGYYLI